MTQNSGYQRIFFSYLGWYLSMETTIMMMTSGNNSWLFHRSSLSVTPEETTGVIRRNGRKTENNSSCHNIKYVKRSLTCRKISRHGKSSFTSHRNESVLRIFIALIDPSLPPCLKLLHLGPMASTLTTTPPRGYNTPVSFLISATVYARGIKWTALECSLLHDELTDRLQFRFFRCLQRMGICKPTSRLIKTKFVFCFTSLTSYSERYARFSC
jgi:hypothetical protein